MIMKLFRSALIVAALLFAPVTAIAQSDNNAARSVITDQLEAFIARDFDRAYSFASDNIKGFFPTVEQFMAMVQGGYLPVLRPGNYAFGNTEDLAEGRIKQDVLIRAPDGSDWTAVYYMQRQPDGTWKVDGVNLRKGAAGMT